MNIEQGIDFLNFLKEIIISHGALLVAIFALVASVRANSISKKSQEISQKAFIESQRIKLFEKRTETLQEIDSQNAKLGTWLTVLGESLSLFRENPKLQEMEPDQLERIGQNVVVGIKLQSKYNEQRNVSEKIGDGADPALQEKAIASIRRLTIHIDEEIKKEERYLESLKEKLKTIKLRK